MVVSNYLHNEEAYAPSNSENYKGKVEFFRLSSDSKSYLIPINYKNLKEEGHLPSLCFSENNGKFCATCNRTELVSGPSDELIIKIKDGDFYLYSLFNFNEGGLNGFSGMSFYDTEDYDFSPIKNEETHKSKLEELIEEFNSPEHSFSKVSLNFLPKGL